MLHMSRKIVPVKDRMAASRARKAAAGQVVVTTYISRDLLGQLDLIKEKRQAASRAPLIEDALRAYIEREQQRA